ncbi:TPM domain-containing protein [Georgenia sp. MJ170]|uniref:TPM domain-containing protein n=1 Tax=Georgenia sunbinii TaxID=3117728 RepID=UPI002F26B647
MTSHRSTAARRFALLPLLALLTAMLALVASPAAAEPPSFLQDRVTDNAGALGGGEAEEIEEAVAELQDETGITLFTVYVDTFDGMSREAWAEQTFTASDMGTDDALLAVAVEDRSFFLGGDTTTVTTEGYNEISSEWVEPELASDSWGAAAVAAAQGLQEWEDGGGSGGGGGGTAFATLLVVGLVLIALIALVVWAANRKKQRTGAPRGPDGRELPADHPLRLPTEELNKRAGSALVAVDDAVRSSEEELGFAQAQFGLQATDTFTKALAEAKQKTGRAFQVRQLLDDDNPETEPQARTMMAEILTLCDEVAQTLESQAAHFTELRDMQSRAPQALTEMEQRAGEVEARLSTAQVVLDGLARRYPAAALTSVAQNPEHARALLDAARDAVAQGRERITADDRPAAVAAAYTAEEAIGQAASLLDAVDRADDDLAQASQHLDAALASIGSDIQDAARLAPDDAIVTPRVVEARAAIEQGSSARQGGDPLAALERLAAAEDALDAALAPSREMEDRHQRARAQLDRRLSAVNAKISGVSEFIRTRRGAVGSEARTRLAEATRLAEDASRLAASDPEAALAALQQAEQRATAAQQLAERDAGSFHDPFGGGGGFGGGQRGGGRRGGLDVGSLILGGILLGGGGGGRRGGWGGGGGFGGGGFGGGGGGFGGGGGGFGGGGGRF